LAFLRGCRIYQFHNTSETARIKQHWPLEDDVCLKEDAANLASFLQRLSKEYPQHYRRIQETIRSCVPFFGEFIFSETASSVSLRWRERDSDLVFGAFQASDGMLRLFALITLLLQPKELLPSVLILDEPELGLHPGAIGLVAELIRKVSLSCQVILATQSTLLVNYFQPEEVVVLNRQGRVSEFRRLSNEALKEWLDDYSLSELWEKNVIGGQPL